MLRILKRIILLIIQLIERFEYRNKKIGSDGITNKFVSSHFTDDFLIETDTGFAPIQFASLTVPFKVWSITTSKGKRIDCADTHILFDENLNEVYTKDLKIGSFIMTKDGQEEVVSIIKSNTSVSMLDFAISDANHRYYTNDILSHNTWMSSVFIVWFTIFHTDKNTLVVSDNASTTKEIVDKIKTIFENMKFFLKPGCITNAVMTLKFDNGCRVIGRSTTKKTGIGFNIHLLYIDEFAHINDAYIDNFFRSIYPTISASKTSKIIITSTPNGMNKFHSIYQDAMDGKTEFVPLRVDWWQFPGRDEEWKRITIANIGSEEDFNQEYGLQFFASDKLLLSSNDLKKIFKLKINYLPHTLKLESEEMSLMDNLTFHPSFIKNSIDNIRNDPSTYIMSIDTADGLGKDFLVCNIFKFAPLPIRMLEPVKHLMKDKMDIFGLVQVGVLRTNTVDINEFCKMLDLLIFKVFNHDKIKINLEMNHKGDYVHEKLKMNENYSIGMMIHSKHTLQAQFFKPGINLTSGEMKIKICERAKYQITCNKIVPNEYKTCMELGAFGKSKHGSYRSQAGNDDLAITVLNLSAFFESPNFWELANEVFDQLNGEYLAEIKEKIFPAIDANLNGRGIIDMNELRKLNAPSKIRTLGNASSLFTTEGINNYNNVLKYFNNS